jgi:hypothetical protein
MCHRRWLGLQIIMAVGVEQRRLPIPADCPPELRKLIKECWRHHANLRPSFAEVLQRLREIKGPRDTPASSSRGTASTHKQNSGATPSKAKFSPALLGMHATAALKGGQGTRPQRARPTSQSPHGSIKKMKEPIPAVLGRTAHHPTAGMHLRGTG